MATKFLGKRLPWPQHSVCWQVHPSLRRWLQGRPDQRLGWRMDQSFVSRCGAVSDVPSKDVPVSVVCFMYFGHLEDHSWQPPLRAHKWESVWRLQVNQRRRYRFFDRYLKFHQNGKLWNYISKMEWTKEVDSDGLAGTCVRSGGSALRKLMSFW